MGGAGHGRRPTSPRYASPEQALSLPIDGKSDVYALCLVMVEAVTGSLPFASDSTVATLSARVGRLMPVSADLGSLAAVLEHAGRPEPDDRSTAAEFGRGLVQAAEKLPRPEPLPLLSTGLFDVPVEQLRNPDDPTGGVVRPGAIGRRTVRCADSADAPTELLLIPLDEPDSVGPDHDGRWLRRTATRRRRRSAHRRAARLGALGADDELMIVPIDVDDDVGTTRAPAAADAAATPEFEPFGAIPAVDRADDLVILGGPTSPIDELAADGGARRRAGHVGTRSGSRRRRRSRGGSCSRSSSWRRSPGSACSPGSCSGPPSTPCPTSSASRSRSPGTRSPGTGGRSSVEHERSDDEPRPGHVIRTAPAAGRGARRGRTVPASSSVTVRCSASSRS